MKGQVLSKLDCDCRPRSRQCPDEPALRVELRANEAHARTSNSSSEQQRRRQDFGPGPVKAAASLVRLVRERSERYALEGDGVDELARGQENRAMLHDRHHQTEQAIVALSLPVCCLAQV